MSFQMLIGMKVLGEICNYLVLFQEMKVVMLEDLAAHFKLKTQVREGIF